MSVLRPRIPAGNDGWPGHSLYLDPTLRAVPDLALRALARETARLMEQGFALARHQLEGADPDEGRLSALADLGLRIRDELEEVGRQPLLPGAVDAMSDGFRLLIHLDDLARDLRALPGMPSGPAADRAGASFALLELAAREGCGGRRRWRIWRGRWSRAAMPMRRSRRPFWPRPRGARSLLPHRNRRWPRPAAGARSRCWG